MEIKYKLKSYKETLDKIRVNNYSIYSEEYDNIRQKADNILKEYVEKLMENGWVEDISEGGLASPDNTLIFYYMRCPYYGMLYNKIDIDSLESIKSVINLNDFVKI